MTPRMRTAEGLLELAKTDDPEIALTLRMIRRFISTGAIHSVAVGRKHIASYDELMDYLRGGAEDSKA